MSAPDTHPTPPADRRALRVPLLLALVVAAGAALFLQPRVVAEVRDGELAPPSLWVAPGALALVVALTALEAWRVARRRGYFPGRSVILVAASAAFVGVLLPETLAEYRARTSPSAGTGAHAEVLAASKDARVRALVMEVAGLRPVADTEVAGLLGRGLEDKDPAVVEAARAAVARRTGDASLDVTRARAVVTSWR